jgi:branched-chain amino acid transport system permease protein
MQDMLNAFALLANFVLIPATAYGSQLALGALGVTIVYGILRFSNFAHGDTMAFGTMITILMVWWLQSKGIGLGALPTALIAMPVAIILTACFVLLTDRWVYRYHRQKKAPSIVFLIVSIGVMFLMNGVVRFVIGPGDQRFEDGERFIISAQGFRQWSGLSEGLVLRTSQGLTIAVAIVVVIILFWFLEKTRTGKSMRAYSDNENLALLSGINPDRVVMITWIIAATLATIAGTLYGLDKGFRPFTYFQLLLPIFAAAIVGGLGSPLGAIAGGFIVAFSEVLLTYAYKKFFTYLLPDEWAPDGLMRLLSTDYKFAISFVILVLVLLIKPNGIFGSKST